MARSYKRSSRKRSRPPGKSFWMRPPVFAVDLKQSSGGVYSSIILTEDDFQAPASSLNDTQKGAPILERLVCTMGYDQIIAEGYFDPAGNNQVTMLVEAMVFTQEDQFATLVTDSTSFESVLENNRILGYEMMSWNMSEVYAPTPATPRQQVRCRSTFAPKSRVRLREKSVAVAIRTGFNVGSSQILATFPWVQPTMLVRVP